MKTWRLKRVTQCEKCPWRVKTDPHTIPNGYTPEKHAALYSTIAKPVSLSEAIAAMTSKNLHIMACHETHDAHCIGWLLNQLGPGNNIGLRLQMRNCENASEVKTIGEQHATFEDTLP